MDISVSTNGIAMLVLALGGAGLVTGFLSGLLGIGGGGILVPVLYEALSALGVDPAIRMHMALGTALAVIAPTSLNSFSQHRARGAVDMAVLRRLGPWIVVGVVLGVLLARASSSASLKVAWIVFGGVLSAKMALGRDDWRLGNDLPRSLFVELYALAVGVASTLMSIGGAAFIITLMTLYGRPLLQAVASSSGFGPLIAIPGVIGFVWAGWGTPDLPPLSLGFVNVLGALLIVPMTFFAVPWGVRLAHGISKRKLELAFSAFLAVVAIRFLVSLIG